MKALLNTTIEVVRNLMSAFIAVMWFLGIVAAAIVLGVLADAVQVTYLVALVRWAMQLLGWQ